MNLTPDQEAVCLRAVLKFGATTQAAQAVEELAELTVALHHYQRGKCGREAVATEIADVIIMAHQLSLMFGADAVQAEVDAKLARLAGRLA